MQIWGQFRNNHIHRIGNLQNKSIRIIKYAPYNTKCNKLDEESLINALYEAIKKVSVKGSIPANIDSLVIANLKRNGLTSQNDIDEKRVLIRRLSFDLRGLPPTQNEVANFLKDKSVFHYTHNISVKA